MSIKFYKICRITVFALSLFFIFNVSATSAEEGFGLWGTSFQDSSGGIQTVPAGYALTAIGYGSDDHKCIIGIQTAAVNADGSVNFNSMDSAWRTVTCNGGAPGRSGDEKYFEPSPGFVVTGWNWGANTSGGSPGNDSSPNDECFYQQYMNLATKQYFNWDSAYDGTCNDRGYINGGWLKNAVYAPGGRVIVGIKFNLDSDAKLESLSMTTRDVPPVSQAKTATLAVKTENLSAPLTRLDLTSSNKTGSGQIANENPTNGGSFTVGTGGCGFVSSDFPPQTNLNHTCPSSTGPFSVTVNSSSTSGGPYSATFQISATGVGSTIVSNYKQNITVNYVASPDSPAAGQVDIKCKGPNESSPSDGPCNVAQGSSATVSWAPVPGKTAISDYCTITRDGTDLGKKANSGSFVTSVNNDSNDTTYKYIIRCNITSGGFTTDYADVKFIGANTCTLLANGSQSSLTIPLNGSVAWGVFSNPSALPYFWHVTGTVNSTDVQGEGTGRTDWSGTYTYSTPGTYRVYFHLEKNGKHDACTSNTVILTVTPADNGPAPEPTPPPPSETSLSCSPNNQSTFTTINPPSNNQYQMTFNASGGNGLYSWTNDSNWSPRSGSGSSYTISGFGKLSVGRVTVTSGSKTAQCCFGAGMPNECSVAAEEPPPPVGALTAATDGTDGRYVCGYEPKEVCEWTSEGSVCHDEEDTSSPVYCQGMPGGNWQDPLDGQSPLNGVDFKYDVGGSSWFRGIGKYIFDCTNDGTVDGTYDINYSGQDRYPIFVQNVCNYPSAGRYMARAQAIMYSCANVSYYSYPNYPRSCIYGEDTATINVSQAPITLSMSAFWNIPSTEASSPSRYQTKWDYNDDNVMSTADATLLANCVGNSSKPVKERENILCPAGNNVCKAGKDCDFNGNGNFNIGDALTYNSYLQGGIKTKIGSGVSGVISLSSPQGGTVTLGGFPRSFGVSPNPISVPPNTTAYANFTVPGNQPIGTSNTAFSGTSGPTTANSNSLNLEFVSNIQTSFSVTVTKGAGGSVTSNDGNINCGSTCSSNYVKGSTVNLTATPSSSYWKFTGWSGDCSGIGSCILNINGSKTVNASFGPRDFNYQEF